MQNNRSHLITPFLFTALFLLAFLGTTIAGSFSFGRVAGISPFKTVAQIAGALAAIGFLISAIIIAITAALQPASWPRKLLYILPAYGLGFTLTGVILALLGIGTVGSFIVIWLAVGMVFSLLALLFALGRMNLNTQMLRTAMNALSITSVLSLIAWVAMVVSIVLVLASPASTVGRGLNNGQEAQTIPTAAATTATSAASGQGQGGGPQRPGGRASSKVPLAIGGALLTIFVALEGWSTVRGRRAMLAEPSGATEQVVESNHGRETGRALLGSLAITLVALGLSQLIPISHTNPPAQTAIQWDSPQTQALAQHACMDCHSNESRWPWYAYVAPGSWLTVSHVNSGREEFNLSALNTLPDFRKANISNQVAQEIRSGGMPPKDYLLIHADARLTEAEKAQLIEGMQKSLATSLAK